MSREIKGHMKNVAILALLLKEMASDGKSDDVGKSECDKIGRQLQEIERLLADEREKVREMCAVVADEFPYSVHGTKKGSRKQECFTNQEIGSAIRQLSLIALNIEGK